MPLAPGESLAGYVLVELLGTGVRGQMWRVRDTQRDRDVTLEELHEHLVPDEERTKRLERESKVLASLDHPNIARLHGVERINDHWWVVSEFVPGESLKQRLSRGPLPVDDALAVCRQVAAALEAAHGAGVVHHNLKPSKVRLQPDGKVKVFEFGLTLGTPAYMAPELVEKSPSDKGVDVWAFGCLLYECLTG